MISAAAIMTIRDEARHLPHAVQHLLSEGIDVVVLDDGSRDGGPESLDRLIGQGLLEIRRRPRSDTMRLRELLHWEETVIKELRHDWVIHVDADEWLMSPQGRGQLLGLINEADRAGATAVNFEEFVFMPIDNLDLGEDPRRHMFHYYFFEPSKRRLMRAWRRGAGLSNRQRAGHRLEGDGLVVHPVNGILRHYPIVTPAHGLQKYGNRRYPSDEVEKGWHRNRLALIEADHIPRPSGQVIRRLDTWTSVDFDRSYPSRFHFWEPEFGGSENSE